MAQKDEDFEDRSSRSPKQRHDSGYASLSLVEESQLAKALSLAKVHSAVRVPEYVDRISIPRLLSWKDIQTRGKVGFVFLHGGSTQDRVFNTMIPMTVSNSAVARVSRFKDTFEQMRKKIQLKHVPAPIPIISNSGRNKDSINSTNQDVRSEPASATSHATWSSLFYNRPSSGTISNGSLEDAADEATSYQESMRKQEILQMPTWRSPAKTPQGNGRRETVSTRAELIAATVKARQAAIEMQFGPGTLQSFHPSYRVLRQQGVLPDYDVNRGSTSTTRSVSPATYRGDPSVEHNRSANIPEEENCALWVWGLPGHVTHKGLLNSIRGVGKIYAVVINPPTGEIRTSAAKIVFFQRFQAERLFDTIEAGRFIVMGKVVYRVAWNKIKSGAYPHLEHSRAIRITGPQQLMNFDFFENFFFQKFAYDLDRRGVVFCNRPGHVSHEWHFGSLRCQAASAKTAIERELKGIFEVEWAVDPCEFL